MGNQGKSFALVSMTNGDVYYVTVEKGKEILRKLTRDGTETYFEATDIKSGAQVGIAIHHVSSVVVKAEGYYADR